MTTYEQGDWTIDVAQPEDAKNIARMQAQSWLDTYLRDGDEVFNASIVSNAEAFTSDERVTMRRQLILRALVNDDEELYILAKNRTDQVVGMLYGPKTEDRQEIAALYTDKNYRGKGLGRALVEIFFTWSDSARPIELGVLDDNTQAQGFYVHMGFKEVPDSIHKFMFNPNMNEITMIRPAEEKK